MKGLLEQIRMFVCEWVLGIIISMAPNNAEGHFLITVIGAYFKEKLKINGHKIKD